jgi:hypothetical protein
VGVASVNDKRVSQGSLAFTGFPLRGAVLIAAMLIAVGLSLRRRARATL